MDRKHYSRKREAQLKRLVEEHLDEFARRAAAREFSGVEAGQRDELIRAALESLPQKVAVEYRRSYVVRGTRGDDLTAPLFPELAE